MYVLGNGRSIHSDLALSHSINREDESKLGRLKVSDRRVAAVSPSIEK